MEGIGRRKGCLFYTMISLYTWFLSLFYRKKEKQKKLAAKWEFTIYSLQLKRILKDFIPGRFTTDDRIYRICLRRITLCLRFIMSMGRRRRKRRRSWNLRIIESENLRGWRMDKGESCFCCGRWAVSDGLLVSTYRKYLTEFVVEDVC